MVRITNPAKYFFTYFRYNMKNRIITSNARMAIHARDRVEKIKSQNIIVGNIWSIFFLFLKNHSTKTGKNAINRNPKLVGLSNKNVFLT